MRPYHALLVTLLGLPGLSCSKKIDATTGDGGGKGAEVVVAARPKSKVKLSTTEYDFGVMEVGEVGRHKFTITSVGDEPLEIKQGKTTCKCTVGGLKAGDKTISKDDTLTLKKGESATIELEWTPTAMQDVFSQSATIHTSDPDKPQIALTIHGHVREVMTLQPAEAWPVGSIDGKTPGKFEGILGSHILDKFQIVSITSGDKSIVPSQKPLSPAELKTHHFKSGYKITVTIKPNDAIGRFEEKLVIKTDARKGLVFSPKITGVRTGPMLIRKVGDAAWNSESMRLALGRFPASKGSSATLLLYVAGLGNDELAFTKVDKDSAELKIDLQKIVDPEAKSGEKADPAQRKQYRLTIAVPPGKEPSVREGAQAVKVTLHTNHKLMKSMTLTVSFNSY